MVDLCGFRNHCSDNFPDYSKLAELEGGDEESGRSFEV